MGTFCIAFIQLQHKKYAPRIPSWGKVRQIRRIVNVQEIYLKPGTVSKIRTL
jgi:hypothetical protein